MITDTNLPKRALILIDVQNEYVSGKLRIEYPPVEVSLANMARAAQAAVAAGIPLVIVQQSAPATSPLFAKDSQGWQLHATVAGLPAALYVEKSLPSAFAGTALAAWLRENAIDTLTVAGYMTQNCNASTVLEAVHAGWSVEYLSDASGAVPYANQAGSASAQEIHEVYCTVFEARFAAVMSTDEWLTLLRTGSRRASTGILASYQQALRESAPRPAPR